MQENFTMSVTHGTRRGLMCAFASAALAWVAPTVQAQTSAVWPTQAVKILVGFPGGSTPDVAARILAEALARAWGQPVVVENRPGAAGNIAADAVAKARDGHTLGVVINGNLTTAPLLNPRLPFDPARDLGFVSLLGTAPLVMVTNADKPGGAEFFAAARAAGASWNYGSVGVGSVGHLGMEALLSQAGVNGVVHVPYNGNPAVLTALMSGQVQIGLMPPGIALPQAQAGKVRVVGVTGPASPLAPGVLPLNTMGVTLQDLEVWTAVVAPAGLPAAARERLERDVPTLLRSPEVRERLLAVGWQSQGTGPDAMRTRVEAEARLLGDIITRQGITTQ